jgi:hypothetical protein
MGSYSYGKSSQGKIIDQLIKRGLVELGEALEKVKVEFKRWHFEQIKNYISALDVAYQ